MAGRIYGLCHKTEWLENERLKQESSTTNWIYIGVDIRDGEIAKIGLTTGSLGTRASSSQNPSYALFYAFKIQEGVDSEKVTIIEDSVKKFLSKSYACIPHHISGRDSEWFSVSPEEMRECVNDFLYENFSSEMDCYHCNVRNIGVILSWENPKFRQGKFRPRYQPKDLSCPPVEPLCCMPGGCGKDCDCLD